MRVVVDPTTGIGSVQNFSLTFADGSSVTIPSLTWDPDPGIIFAIGATTGAFPAVFSFAFSTPLSPGLNGSILANSSIGYTFTDGALAGVGGPAGVTLSPFSGSNVLVANDFFPQTNKGVDVGPTATGGSGVCGAFAGATSTCGPFAATNTFSSGANTFTLMGATVSFVLTAHDAASLSGSVSQMVVPEPSALLEFPIGLLVAGGMISRGHRPKAS